MREIPSKRAKTWYDIRVYWRSKIKMKKGIYFFVLSGLLLFGMVQGARAEALSPEGVADVSRPGVVHIGTHILGRASVPAVKVDVRARQFEIIPDSFKEVSVNEYVSGSGFVIEESGFIATNAHVVSSETLKYELAQESALAGLFQNALYLSDAEMDTLMVEGERGFLNDLLQFVLRESTFELESRSVILDPHQETADFPQAVNLGTPLTLVSETENFLTGGEDIALLRTEALPAPALLLGDSNTLTVGSRVFLLGFPSTAEAGRVGSRQTTFTSGVVSAIRMTPEGRKIYQTDAKVSQGSSGGPLLNEEGAVVGIVTFQTDALERENGDNFAFAQSIDGVRTLAENARITPSEGQFSQSFRKGFVLFAERRCERALEYFRQSEKVHALYLASEVLEGYRQDCRAWQSAGTARDSLWSSWDGLFRNQHLSVWLLFFGSLFFGIILLLFVLWLLRQVRRDEMEIGRLEERLRADERHMLQQDTLLRQTRESKQKIADNAVKKSSNTSK